MNSPPTVNVKHLHLQKQSSHVSGVDQGICEQRPDEEESLQSSRQTIEDSQPSDILKDCQQVMLIEDLSLDQDDVNVLESNFCNQNMDEDMDKAVDVEDYRRQDEDEPSRQLTKSLSKTDSLRDLKQFFSREQRKINNQLDSSNDPVSFRSE